ncbi:Dynamin family protein [Pirellulimonas nuda]|uniref:Dynamin family protein n=1 Tax=Pirellulimonas nuda TaxID=2528009 RepID=A0A518DHG3_9BACT|nr:Dynamin family protein [Pirellulimonas nuda]
MTLRDELFSPTFLESAERVEGAGAHIERFRSTIDSVLAELENEPAVRIALLGPSRHGKSTLLNALASASILPTSDIKPCTAAIVSLKHDGQWGFTIEFISERRLDRERRRAVEEARDYLHRLERGGGSEEEPDDPRFIHSTLERFVTILGIDPTQSAAELVRSVADAPIPDEVARLLGHKAQPKSDSLPHMRVTIERYLSTKDIFWTIIDRCEIRGPFRDWHPNLQLVDLPGTNDNDPQRTEITNSLRKEARAVAVCTSDSNLGIDITSWLRSSSVLGDYLEATDSGRQQLFIIKTKFDAHIPEFDLDDSAADDPDAEERLYRAAIDRHIDEQTQTYRKMLRDIASPLMPLGNSEEDSKTRSEMLERIASIRVFFVSALAYEAFQKRISPGRVRLRGLMDQFGGDPDRTGIPELKHFVNQIAAEHLARFYFDDLEQRVAREVGRLVRFFSQAWATLEAGVGEGSGAIARLVAKLDEEIIPWFDDYIDVATKEFVAGSNRSAREIRESFGGLRRALEERIASNRRSWNVLYWNTLRAVARKKGIHTTGRGEFIDVNQALCGAMVDGLSSGWTTFRDKIIQSASDSLVVGAVDQLRRRIRESSRDINDGEATAALEVIAENLESVAATHSESMSEAVQRIVHDLQSIRKPAYDVVQDGLGPTYTAVVNEGGIGCQARMRERLGRGAEASVQDVHASVAEVLDQRLFGLCQGASSSLMRFRADAIAELRNASAQLRRAGEIEQRGQMIAQMEHIRTAALQVWEAVRATSRVPTAYMAPLSLPPPEAPRRDSEAPLLPFEPYGNQEPSPTDSPNPAPEPDQQSGTSLGDDASSAGVTSPANHDADGAAIGQEGPATSATAVGASSPAGGTTVSEPEEPWNLSNRPRSVTQRIPFPEDPAPPPSNGPAPPKEEPAIPVEVTPDAGEPPGEPAPPADESPSDFLDRLLSSPLYREQRDRCGRAALNEGDLRRFLDAMQRSHWSLTTPALCRQLGLGRLRVEPRIAAVQRLLNVDGLQIVQFCRDTDTVEIKADLLSQEFTD